jgi:hypothetical protein
LDRPSLSGPVGSGIFAPFPSAGEQGDEPSFQGFAAQVGEPPEAALIEESFSRPDVAPVQPDRSGGGSV